MTWVWLLQLTWWKERCNALQLSAYLHTCMCACTPHTHTYAHIHYKWTNKQTNKLCHSGCTHSLVQCLRINVFIYFIFKFSFKSILHEEYIPHNIPPFFFPPSLSHVTWDSFTSMFMPHIHTYFIHRYKNREPRVVTYKSFWDCLICVTRLAPAASVFLKMTSIYVFRAERNSAMNTSHFPRPFLSCWMSVWVCSMSELCEWCYNKYWYADISGVCWLEAL